MTRSRPSSAAPRAPRHAVLQKMPRKTAVASALQSSSSVRPLLPIVLALPIVACSSSTPPSPAVGTATVSDAVVDGGGRSLLTRAPLHVASLHVSLPAADATVRRYAFWADSPQRGVEVTEVPAPAGNVLRVAWRGASDAPIALHVVAYDVDPANGTPVAWPGGATREAQPLHGGDAWSVALAPTATHKIATRDFGAPHAPNENALALALADDAMTRRRTTSAGALGEARFVSSLPSEATRR
jgi:hypothetical protein